MGRKVAMDVEGFPSGRKLKRHHQGWRSKKKTSVIKPQSFQECENIKVQVREVGL